MNIKHRMNRLVLVPAALLLAMAPAAQAGVIDFEGLADGTVLLSQYGLTDGATFSNAIVLTAGISLNEFDFPPLSGTNVASDSGGAMSVGFSLPVLSVGGYFTYLAPLTITAYDAANNVVATATSAYPANNTYCTAAGCNPSPNEFISVSFSQGISAVTFAGDPAGGSFTVDNLTYTLPSDAVPEPSRESFYAMLLLVGGMAVRGLRASWQRQRVSA
jgi:hypothetical protein